jgi:predicted porin
MGTIRLGNQFTPYAMSFFNDPTEYDDFSPIWQGGFFVNGYAGLIGHSDMVWKNNSISYTSPTFNNFNFTVMAAPGADGADAQGQLSTAKFDAATGNPLTLIPAHAATSYSGVGLNYAPMPELALSYGWESYNNGVPGAASTTAWNLGAALKTMGITLYADVNRAENALLSDNGWYLSAAAPVSGTWSLQGGYASNETTAAKTTGLTGVVLNDIHKQVRLYAGFKRTTLTAAPDATTYLAGAKYSF